MALIDDAAENVARALDDATKAEVKARLQRADLSDAELASLAGRGTVASVATDVGRVAAEQPSQVSETAVGGLGKTAIGVTGLGAGGFALGKGAEAFGDRAEAREAQSAKESFLAAMENPALTAEQKQNAFEQFTEAGFFSQFGGDESGGGGLFGDILGNPTSNIGQTIVLVLVIYFGGKAAVEFAGSRGGSGGGS